MAITNSTRAAVIARCYAELVNDEPAAKQLWFRQCGHSSRLWLVTETEDLQTERRLRSAGRRLYKRFPHALIDFQVINTALSSQDLSAQIPADAESLALH